MISVSGRKWQEKKINEKLAEKIEQDYDLSKILSKLIVSRNFDKDEIETLKLQNYAPSFLEFFNGKINFKILPIDYNLEFNSNHPYNRNNGTMIPNRGYQHIISPGFFAKIGPLEITLKPEHHFAENKNFEGFWEAISSNVINFFIKRWNINTI